jgi:hypothetical protein
LRTDERGAIYQERLKRWKEEMEARDRENRQYRAHPVPEYKPFIIKPSDKPLTETLPIKLNSEERAQQRAAFDEKVRERQALIELNRIQKEKEDEVCG